MNDVQVSSSSSSSSSSTCLEWPRGSGCLKKESGSFLILMGREAWCLPSLLGFITALKRASSSVCESPRTCTICCPAGGAPRCASMSPKFAVETNLSKSSITHKEQAENERQHRKAWMRVSAAGSEQICLHFLVPDPPPHLNFCVVARLSEAVTSRKLFSCGQKINPQVNKSTERDSERGSLTKPIWAAHNALHASHIPPSSQSVFPLCPCIFLQGKKHKLEEITAGKRRFPTSTPKWKTPRVERNTKVYESSRRKRDFRETSKLFFHIQRWVQIHVIVWRGGVAGFKAAAVAGQTFEHKPWTQEEKQKKVVYLFIASFTRMKRATLATEARWFVIK